MSNGSFLNTRKGTIAVPPGGVVNVAGLIPAGAMQVLTISSGVVQLAALPTDCEVVYLEAEGVDDARFTLDGSDPDTVTGHVFVAGANAVWGKSLAESARFIRTVTDVTLWASPLKAGE